MNGVNAVLATALGLALVAGSAEAESVTLWFFSIYTTSTKDFRLTVDKPVPVPFRTQLQCEAARERSRERSASKSTPCYPIEVKAPPQQQTPEPGK